MRTYNSDVILDPSDLSALVRVWTIHKDEKLEAKHILKPQDYVYDKDKVRQTGLTLRDYLDAKIRREEEDRDIDLTP